MTEWDRLVASEMPVHPDLLACLATDPNERVRREVAANWNTPAEVLTGLATDPDPYTRVGVAGNAHTPVGTLVLLADDASPKLRESVAWNSNTPTCILDRLSRDDHHGVRMGAASNRNTSPGVLVRLADDPNPSVPTRDGREQENPRPCAHPVGQRPPRQRRRRLEPHHPDRGALPAGVRSRSRGAGSHRVESQHTHGGPCRSGHRRPSGDPQSGCRKREHPHRDTGPSLQRPRRGGALLRRCPVSHTSRGTGSSRR